MHDRGWGWISAYLKEGIVDPQGGTLNFHAYIGSDPASTVNPPKISSLKGTKKNMGISGIPKKIFEILLYPKQIFSMYTFTFH